MKCFRSERAILLSNIVHNAVIIEREQHCGRQGVRSLVCLKLHHHTSTKKCLWFPPTLWSPHSESMNITPWMHPISTNEALHLTTQSLKNAGDNNTMYLCPLPCSMRYAVATLYVLFVLFSLLLL